MIHRLAIAAGLSLILASGAALTQAQEFDDPDITTAVTEELLQDPGVEGAAIDVETYDGVVTLSGTVDNVLAKQRATRIAETVKGVRAITNRIDLSATDRTDTQIRRDVETALLNDRATESFQIDVYVENGDVTLTGTVDSWQEKQLAERVAKGIRGAMSIENNIIVDYKMERPDSEIRTEIEKALHWNKLVDDAMIDVRVTDGEVTLAGTVGSAAEKRQVRIDAWVTGVESVDASGLKVAKWARDPDLARNKYADKSDAEIEQAVEDAMLYDPRVESFEIEADAENGIVTLTGTVDHLKARRAAADDARNTVGVWRVKNHIKVRNGEEDLWAQTVEDRIESALIRDPYVDRYEINVFVKNGEATLSGTVDTYFEKAQADDVASRVTGVMEVNNNLAVDDTYEPLTYDPYVDDEWYLYDYDWYSYPTGYSTTQSDWEIKEDIDDEMWWSPFVDSDEVIVTVDNGVATLTGTVDTWSERRAAAENAYEGGAIAVDNDLSVSYGPEYYTP